MRSAESGFTLIEIVIAVGITVMMLTAGGVWMMSMHPAALSAAVSGFDDDIEAARAIAQSSGNGATVTFVPVASGGFTMTVYSGRPRAAGMVSATNVASLQTSVKIAERSLGAPPFALFFDSRGDVSASASYPSVGGDGSVSFPVMQKQPPCPQSGGFLLTFTAPDAATTTRTLTCDGLIYGTAAPNPSPTPNAGKIEPASLVAHWTRDINAQGGPLAFKVVAYGYYHWYASSDGNACSNITSQTGASPIVYASGWPWASPQHANEASLSPATPAPSVPWTWPSGDPNDPPAWFTMHPVAGNPGTCTGDVVDDNGQRFSILVQVMGDLAVIPAPATTPLAIVFQSPTAPAQTITLGKSFDSEALLLNESGGCGGLVDVTQNHNSVASSPSTTPTSAQLTIAPVAAGSCTMTVGDQYGEPGIPVQIDVRKAQAAFKTWPAVLIVGSSGATVGTTSGVPSITMRDPGARLMAMLAPWVNGALGGATAQASGSQLCYAWALTAGSTTGPGTPDSTLPSSVASALGIGVTTDGCIISASSPYAPVTAGQMIAYEPSGSSGNWATTPVGCGGLGLVFGGWDPSQNAVDTSIPATGGARSGQCTVNFGDGQSTQTPTADNGQVTAIDLGACGGSTCYMSLTNSQSAEYWGCDTSSPEVCSGEVQQSPGDTNLAITYYSSTNGGVTWTYLGDYIERISTFETRRCQGIPSVCEYYVYALGSQSYTAADGTVTTAAYPSFLATPAWVPSSFNYTDLEYWSGGAVYEGGGTTSATQNGPSWSPAAPAGLTTTSGAAIAVPPLPTPNPLAP